MNTLDLLLLAVGLSMDAFAVSICKGLSLGKINWRHMALAGLWFGGFQALMPTIGYGLGSFFADMIDAYDHWVTFILLSAIGLNMIKESFEDEEHCDASMSPYTMLMLAIATSIDALRRGHLRLHGHRPRAVCDAHRRDDVPVLGSRNKSRQPLRDAL